MLGARTLLGPAAPAPRFEKKPTHAPSGHRPTVLRTHPRRPDNDARCALPCRLGHTRARPHSASYIISLILALARSPPRRPSHSRAPSPTPRPTTRSRGATPHARGSLPKPPSRTHNPTQPTRPAPLPPLLQSIVPAPQTTPAPPFHHPPPATSLRVRLFDVRPDGRVSTASHAKHSSAGG